MMNYFCLFLQSLKFFKAFRHGKLASVLSCTLRNIDTDKFLQKTMEVTVNFRKYKIGNKSILY